MGHGQVEVGRLQLGDRPAGPVREHVEDPLAQLGRLEDAAVEQDGRGQDRRPAGVERAGLLAEEPGEVARDRRVGGVGQADLGQADAAPARRHVGRRARAAGTRRAGPVSSISRVSSVLIEPPMTFEPRPRTVTGAAFFLRSVNSVSLAVRQAWPSATRWAASSPSIPWGKRGGHGVGQGEVHVVAAEQDVLADGQPREGQVAPLVGHGDQGEVGRPAADVADQDDVADLHLLPPLLALGGEPGVEGGLRLLEQRHLLQARPWPAASVVSSRATASNEAGHGQEDVLVLQPVGGGLAGDRARSRRRAGVRGRPPRPRPARSLATSSAAVQGRIGGAAIDARRARASSWPS